MIDILDEEADEGVEVGRIPFALHVAFGEADVGREHDAAEGVLVRDLDARSSLGLRVAERELRAFGQTEGEAALESFASSPRTRRRAREGLVMSSGKFRGGVP